MGTQIQDWFRLADEDRDGGVGGAEAVKFFTRSGLPQDVLWQIWEYSSGGGAKLNIMQFSVAMRLVALAQASSGRLVPDQARITAMGGGPQLPPPRLAGVTDAPTPTIPTYTLQITGLTPQMTGGMRPPVYTAQQIGSAPPTPGAYTPQLTGQPGGYGQPQVTGVRPPGPYTPPGTTGGVQGYTPQQTGSAPGYAPQTTGLGLIGVGPTGGAAGPTGGVAPGPTGGVTSLPGFPPVTPADVQRYQAAFAATDTDKDGFAKGAECFPVFIKSGLDKALLKRMWDMVAGNAGSLDREQFCKCLYLMDGCRRGAQLPAVLPPGPWPQVTVGGPPLPAAAGATGALPSTGYPTAVPAAGPTGGPPSGGFSAAPPATPAAPTSGPLSTGYLRAQPVAAAAARPPVPGVFPYAVPGVAAMPPQQLQRPLMALPSGDFAQALPAYPTGMPVADDVSGARSSGGGGAPPSVDFGATSTPEQTKQWTLDSQFGDKGAVRAISDAYDQTLPKIPDPPGKVKFEGVPAPAAGPSSVPDLAGTVASMLAPADRARWEVEQQEALVKEQQHRAAEAGAAAAKARLETFQAALSELVVYKSRVDVALLQASDSAARLTTEAEDMELRYHKAQLAAQSQAEAGSVARQKLQALLQRKQEAANKVELLQQELAMIQNLNPAELVALEKEVGALVAQAAAAESRKAAMEMQLDSGRKQKQLLAERIQDLQLAAAAGEGDIRRAKEELEQLQRKATLSPDEVKDVAPLLGKAASAYRRLYTTAMAAGVEVPYEANLNNVGSLVWLEQLMAGTADWAGDDETVQGYTVVNALPDLEGVPPALLRAAALAAAQQPPIQHSVLSQGGSAAETAAGKEAAAAGAAAEENAAAEFDAAAYGQAYVADGAAAGEKATSDPAKQSEPEGQSIDIDKSAGTEATAAGEVEAISTDELKEIAEGEGAVAAVAATVVKADDNAELGSDAVSAGGCRGDKTAAPSAEAGSQQDKKSAKRSAVAAPAAEHQQQQLAAASAPQVSADAHMFEDDAFGGPDEQSASKASDSAPAAAAKAIAAAAGTVMGLTAGAAASAAAGLQQLVGAEDEQAETTAPAIDGNDSATAAKQAVAATDTAAVAAAAVQAVAIADDDAVQEPLAAPALDDDSLRTSLSDSQRLRSLNDEDDSDLGTYGLTPPLTHEQLSAVPEAAAGEAATRQFVAGLGGLPGFDPAVYRLSPEQMQQLGHQDSVDSSYAGSFIERSPRVQGASAGATGASTTPDLDEPAPPVGNANTQGLGFEDNAF